MTEHLYLFQIGPVQSFIAQARRTADLYVGSRLLSLLAGAGVCAALANDVKMLFPAVKACDKLPDGVPHQFAFISDHADPKALAKQIEAEIYGYWRREFVEPMREQLKPYGQRGWEAEFDRQAEGWLEFYWVAVPTASGSHGAIYEAAGKYKAARKMVRHFPQVEDSEKPKCTMTNAIAALSLDWKALRSNFNRHGKLLRENEELSAVALIKRLGALIEDTELHRDRRFKGFPSTASIAGNKDDRDEEGNVVNLEYPYLAVLMMDGDRMGERISKCRTVEEHQQLSQKITQFAEAVEGMITGQGRLIYAGGDDVLAMLPLNKVLETADAIRRDFEQIVGGTMSAGIAIMAVNTPLEIALDAARTAEKSAKKDYGRNAVVIRDVRSSAIREAGAKWKGDHHGSEIVKLVTELQSRFNVRKGGLSGKLGYDMHDIARYMCGSGLPEVALEAELARLIKRRWESGKADDIAKLTQDLAALAKDNTWEAAANWVIIARFLATGGKRGN
ncbi:MAG: hypothetical protein OHK0023_12010 [Anaerolineae bacterium]